MKHQKESKKTKVFVMRMNDETRSKLEDLAANKIFKYNSTALLTHLINTEHLKTFKPDGNH